MHPYNRGQKSIKRTKKTYFFSTQIYRAYTYNMQIQIFFTNTGYVIVKNVLITFQKKNGILIIFAKVKIKVLHGTGIMEGETISQLQTYKSI